MTTATTTDRAELLETADLLLSSIQMLVSREYGEAFRDHPAESLAVDHRLNLARRAVRDLATASQSPARLAHNTDVVGLRPGGPAQTTTSGREKSPVRGSRPVQQGRSSGLDPIAPGVGSGGGVGGHAAVADADVPGIGSGCKGRADGARPRYFEGGRRLIGRVEMNDQTRPNPTPIGVPKPPLLPKPGPPPPPPPKVAEQLFPWSLSLECPGWRS